MKHLWWLFRQWLHQHGQHRLCIEDTERYQVGTDFGKEWLVGRDKDGVIVHSVEATVFGGRPIYKTRKVHR